MWASAPTTTCAGTAGFCFVLPKIPDRAKDGQVQGIIEIEEPLEELVDAGVFPALAVIACKQRQRQCDGQLQNAVELVEREDSGISGTAVFRSSASNSARRFPTGQKRTHFRGGSSTFVCPPISSSLVDLVSSASSSERIVASA